MSDHPRPPAPAPSGEEEMAAALDAALDDLLAGRPLNRTSLLGRFPQLASALGALDRLFTASTSTQPAVPLPPAPESIGPYRVERVLGAGGFGVVYLAYDPDVKRRVAVKLLHPGRLDQPEVVERFQREACAIGRLRHPGIVQLFDYSRNGPPYFLVTEFVEGVEPRQWCRNLGASLKERAGLVARIADAVEYAHGQGVFHRDLKPGNILIDADGAPHVLDFGLARLDLDLDGATVVTNPTVDGHILGSLSYMPPEQAAGHGHSADARSDVYSLGVILYELLTGRLPFQGPAHSLPARVVADAPPSPRRLNPAIPHDLEAVCLKALAKRPAERYESAAALARDLRAYRDGQPVSARRATVLGKVGRTLNRRHLETQRRGWTFLLLMLGLTIFIGCAMANYWELALPPQRAWLPMLLTKLVQVGVMLWLAITLRPAPEGAEEGPPASPEALPISAAERQIWNLVPAYYGGFLTLLIANRFLNDVVPLGPVLAVLSGMGFLTLGATIWGWFYVWGLAFFALALVIVLCAPSYGLLILGLGWFVCLVVGSVHLRWTR